MLFYPPTATGCPGPPGRSLPSWSSGPRGPDRRLRAGLRPRCAAVDDTGCGRRRGGLPRLERLRPRVPPAARRAWGVADAEDCMAAAAPSWPTRGLVDRAADGGAGARAPEGSRRSSASGPAGPFAAAVVSYGVTDLAALAADTHKFEARYIDGLVGPLPEAAAALRRAVPGAPPRARSRERSCCSRGRRIPSCPPDQAARMAEALRARGVRCDHVVFDGEGHGCAGPTPSPAPPSSRSPSCATSSGSSRGTEVTTSTGTPPLAPTEGRSIGLHARRASWGVPPGWPRRGSAEERDAVLYSAAALFAISPPRRPRSPSTSSGAGWPSARTRSARWPRPWAARHARRRETAARVRRAGGRGGAPTRRHGTGTSTHHHLPRRLRGRHSRPPVARGPVAGRQRWDLARPARGPRGGGVGHPRGPREAALPGDRRPP